MIARTVCVCIAVVCVSVLVESRDEVEDIQRIFSPCKRNSTEFDACIKRAFNKLKPYFKVGIPALGVAPFDPHYAPTVLQSRGLLGVTYNLTLMRVYERGWSRSTVTKYKTDWNNEQIIYSQYFPEKWLEGDYDFRGQALGAEILRGGRWNLTLRDYSQTTRIRRSADRHGVVVSVEVDHIGDMDIHVGNLLRGSSFLESILDRIINATWKPGFAVIRPLINDLVSTAFTAIWSKSFRDFHIDTFITD